MTGKTVGKYRIVGHLGSGGMGTVYHAVDETLEREVAIKVLNRGLTDPKILKRFRAEATTLAKLNHPAIATIYELFEFEGELLLAMEFVRGETLERLAVRVGLLTTDQAVFLVDRILSALAHTHRAGIVHCDMKPANVMVTVQGGVKIMDFGTARVLGAEQATVHGYMMGTPAYMPPEQLLGHELDGRTDLYAVGVLLYRLLSGTFPFTADTPIDAMRKQLADEPTPLRIRRPDLPEWCDPIVQRALAKAPHNRYQNADEFRDALHAATGIVTTELTRAFVVADGQFGEVVAEPTIVEEIEAPNQTFAQTTMTVAAHDGPRTATILVPRRRLTAMRALLLLVGVATPLLAIGMLRAPTTGVANASPPPAEAPKPADIPAPPPAPAPAIAAAAAPAPAPALPTAPTPAEVPAQPPPFAFKARVLAGDVKRSEERACRVLLANGRITVRAEDARDAMYIVAYDRVVSMAYSHGRDPLWHGPQGPTPVMDGGRHGFLGMFGARDWLALRVADLRQRFVVLRFDDDDQLRRAIRGLEQRTELRVERISTR